MTSNSGYLKFLKHYLSCWIFFLTPFFLFAQKEGNIWYFGDFAGIDFNPDTPLALNDGALNTKEGCASICDKNGQLKFYTDGIKVWNRRHKMMPEGKGLKGHPSSTQSGVIVPKPKNPDLHYIFTVDAWGDENGLQYSIVDMKKDNGFGDVVSKNILIYTPASEKITAVKHANNVDIWVITHEMESRNFVSYLVSDEPFDPKRKVVSRAGMIHRKSESMALGAMKASPDGSMIALANFTRFFELFNFDNRTGKVSNAILIDLMKDNGSYGVEFAPNQKFLYVTSERSNKIIQLDISRKDGKTISESAEIIGISASPYMGGLQLGPDGKIYIARWESKYLGLIHHPNEEKQKCKYEDNGFYLDEKLSRQGLPTFVQTYFQDPEMPAYAYPCGLEACSFKVPHAFSPSGKAAHNEFRPLGCEPDGYKLYVFDQADELLLKTDNFYQGWDGRIRLEDAPSGNYKYLILYKEDNGHQVLMKGEVCLIR